MDSLIRKKMVSWMWKERKDAEYWLNTLKRNA